MTEHDLFDRNEADKRIQNLKKRCKNHIENGRFAQAETTLSMIQSLDERRHLLDQAEQRGIDFTKNSQQTLEDAKQNPENVRKWAVEKVEQLKDAGCLPKDANLEDFEKKTGDLE